MLGNRLINFDRSLRIVAIGLLGGLFLLLSVLQLGTSVQAQEGTDVLFVDDFGDFDASVWEEASYLKAIPGVEFLGKPNHHLKSTNWNGNSVLRMTSVLSPHQRTGIGTVRSFAFTQGRIVVDFHTMPLVDDEVPAANQRNIDGLIGLWLFNPRNDRQVNIRLWGGNFGRNRSASIGSGFAGPGASRSAQAWEYDQTYRFVIEASDGRTHLAFKHASGGTIVDHTYNFHLGALGEFHIVLSQSMGAPDAEYYADVAVDSVRVTEY